MEEDLGKEPYPVGENNIAYTDATGRRARGVVVVDGEGKQVGSRLHDYKVSDTDDENSRHYYYGFERSDSSWYIMREAIVAGLKQYRYIKGSGDFATNFINRAGLTYTTFASAF